MPYSVKIMPNLPIRSNRSKSRSEGAQRVVAVLAYDGVSAFELGLAIEVFGLSNMGPVILAARRSNRMPQIFTYFTGA